MLENLQSKLTFRRLSGLLLSFAIISIVVLFQLVMADFSIDAFKSPDFYIRVLYRVVLIILVYQAVINLLYDRCMASPKVQDARAKYKAAVKLKDVSFNSFLKEYNYNLKAEAWIDKIDRKLNRINRKMEAGKNVKRYSKKIEYLESLKTPEYIEKNWSYLNCKWKQVFIGDFTIEDSITNNEKRARSEFGKDVIKYSSKKVSGYLFASLVLGLVVVNLAFDGVKTASFWFNMILDIILVIMRATDAGLQTPILIDYNFTNVYLYKVEVMEMYIQWCESNNLEESKAHRVLSYIEEVEVEKQNQERLENNEVKIK